MDKDKTEKASQDSTGIEQQPETADAKLPGAKNDEPDKSGSTGDNGDEGGTGLNKASSNLFAGLIGFGFWVVVLGIFGYNYFGLGDPVADIIVTASPQYDSSKARVETWSLNGHVILDGKFISKVPVWAIVVDQRGNRQSTDKQMTDGEGSFSFTGIPNSLTGDLHQTIVEIVVYVSDSIETKDSEGDTSTIELNPKPARVGVGSGQQYRVINLPIKELIVIGLIFTLSVAIALIPVPQGSKTTGWLVGKYLSSVFFAFLMTGFMVLYISLGLKYVNQTASNVENEILSFGVANIYKGRYVADVNEEWLISLTSPTFAKPLAIDSNNAGATTIPQSVGSGQLGGNGNPKVEQNTANLQPDKVLERGFGAPLWVLLVSVIGSALFTISIILVGIKEAPLQLNPKQIRERIQAIVLHQFYILFSPIGAIFIYQLLVMAGAASQTSSVAIIALAAGVALNYLLAWARTRVENLVSS